MNAQKNVEAGNVYVVYTDSHFVVIAADSEPEAEKLNGRILGHYQTSEAANEAMRTTRTVAMLGYGHALKIKD
jgi:hypothetical protein